MGVIARTIIEEVSSWPGVESHPHRFGGVEFTIDHREFGHLHGDRLAAEEGRRAYARRFGEDEDIWGTVGLVHDLDYERCPSQEAGHPLVGVEELRRRGVPEAWCRAVLAHADYSGVPRQSNMEKALYGVDELVGFIIAVALVKPGRSLAVVDVASVKKKMKDKAFARGVNREDVLRGADELGVPLDEHIDLVIQALRGSASQLGL